MLVSSNVCSIVTLPRLRPHVLIASGMIFAPAINTAMAGVQRQDPV